MHGAAHHSRLFSQRHLGTPVWVVQTHLSAVEVGSNLF